MWQVRKERKKVKCSHFCRKLPQAEMQNNCNAMCVCAGKTLCRLRLQEMTQKAVTGEEEGKEEWVRNEDMSWHVLTVDRKCAKCHNLRMQSALAPHTHHTEGGGCGGGVSIAEALC